MKIHRHINDSQADVIREMAISIGLDAIDYKKMHRLYKIASKDSYSFAIELKEKRLSGKGDIQLLGSGKYVWLYMEDGLTWFKTSPIISCKSTGSGFILETENSFYELVEES